MRLNSVHLIIIALLLAAAIICIQLIPESTPGYAVVHPGKNLTSLVITEVFKLEQIAQARNLTKADLDTLSAYASQDPKIQDTVSELDWLIVHGFQMHAYHTLQAIYAIETNTTILCPFDPLSHVAIYLEYNETRRAIDAAKEAEVQLPGWLAKASTIHAKNATFYPNLPVIVAVMRREIKEMDTGQYTLAASDAQFVSDNGYC